MPRIKRKAPPRYTLVPDTNVLWHREKDVVTCPEFEAFWSAYGERYNIGLVLPAVVYGELLYQHTTSAMTALERANKQMDTLSAIAAKRYEHKVTEARVRSDVQHKIDGWLASIGGRVEPTPIHGVDWDRLINDAIWRRPPFLEDKENEKGFRDSLILETMCAISAGSPAPNVAFVSSDQLLLGATKERVSKSCLCHESLDEFSSYLRLLDQELTEEFVRAIQHRARTKFFSKGDKTCLFAQAQIVSSVRNQFSDKLAPPKAPVRPLGLIGQHLRYNESWKPVTDETVWIAPPSFVALSDEVNFDWQSNITFVQLFQYTGPPVNALLLDSVANGEERLRKMRFSVLWSARVSRDGRFRSMSVKEIKTADETFAPPTNEEVERYGLRPKPSETGA